MKLNWRNLISGPANPAPVVAKDAGDPIPLALARISILSERFNKLYQTGKFAKAIPIAQESLEISEKTLGPDHLQTSMLLNNLAEMFRLTEDYGKAEPLFQRALAVREKELGPDHPQTATVLNNLALLYTSLKEYTKAEPLQQRSLEIDEKTLGPDHPQTASALGNLAALYYVMGEHAKAEPLYERSLKICEQALGVNHPQTTTIRQNLATVKESLIASGESVGPAANDEAKIVSLNQRVALLYKLGDYAEAIPVAQECVDLSEKVFGPDDPKTAREVNNLAELYNVMADLGNAAQLYQRSLDICVKTLGPIDPQTVTVFHNLDALKRKAVAKIESLHDQAAVLYNRKQYAEAIPIAQECLELSEKVVGPDDADTARKLLMVGVLYRKSGDHFTAEPLYQRALKILEKELGPEHPDTAQALNHLGLLYEGMSDYAKAEPLYERSLEICEKTLGVDDVQTIAIQRNLTTTRESLNLEKGPAAAGAPLDSLKFSNNELNTLLFAPMWVYSAVSEVDGAPKDYEKEAWNREVSTPESYTSPLFQFVLELVRAKWDTFRPHWSADTRSTPNGLRDVRRIADSKLHVDDAREFKESLYKFGRAIAESGGEEAPGGGVLQMPKASLDEQDVLIDIGIMLGLQDGVRPLSPWVNSMIAALDERAGPPADKALH